MLKLLVKFLKRNLVRRQFLNKDYKIILLTNTRIAGRVFSRTGDSRSTAGLNGFVGAFCYSGEAFQSPPFMLPSPVSIKFLLDNFIGPVRLVGAQNLHAYRSGYQVRHLQPCRIALLVGKNNFKWQDHPLVVIAVANTTKLKFQ